jgi:protein sidekick
MEILVKPLDRLEFLKLILLIAPSRGVTELKVVPITTSSIEVHWNPIDELYWSGDHETGGYRVFYQPLSDFPSALSGPPKEEVKGINVCLILS